MCVMVLGAAWQALHCVDTSKAYGGHLQTRRDLQTCGCQAACQAGIGDVLPALPTATTRIGRLSPAAHIAGK